MSALFLRLRKLHGQFFHYIEYLQSPFLLFVRLYWGWQLVQSGWGKLHNLGNVTDFFTSLGLPAPGAMAVFISCLEFFGGILFGLGLFSRIISLMLSVNMIVAYITADREALLSIFSDPDKFYAAAPYTFLIASLIVLLFGPGWLCLDELFSRVFGWKEDAVPEQRAAQPVRP
jgi:putative oxidoreductase